MTLLAPISRHVRIASTSLRGSQSVRVHRSSPRAGGVRQRTEPLTLRESSPRRATMNPVLIRKRNHTDSVRAGCSHSVHFSVSEWCSRSSPRSADASMSGSSGSPVGVSASLTRDSKRKPASPPGVACSRSVRLRPVGCTARGRSYCCEDLLYDFKGGLRPPSLPPPAALPAATGTISNHRALDNARHHERALTGGTLRASLLRRPVVATASPNGGRRPYSSVLPLGLSSLATRCGTARASRSSVVTSSAPSD